MAPMGQRYRQKKRWIKTDPTKITRISAPPIENIGFTPGQCPNGTVLSKHLPRPCDVPFYHTAPYEDCPDRSTPYLIQPVGTFLPLFFEFECRFFAPAFRNRFFQLISCKPQKILHSPRSCRNIRRKTVPQ